MNGPVPLYATSLHSNLTLAAHQWPVTREEGDCATQHVPRGSPTTQDLGHLHLGQGGAQNSQGQAQFRPKM